VEVTGLNKGKHDLPLKLNVPKDLSLKGEVPKIHVVMEAVKR
jgi:hypothetical protein